MLNTILFFLVFILPKVLFSLVLGILILFFSMDVFLFFCPDKALELLFAFLDLIVCVISFGSCTSLEEFNEKQKKDNSEQIDPFDLF